MSIEEDQDYVLKLKHNSGVSVDVFFHWIDNGKLLHGSSYLYWSNTPFEFMHLPFYGSEYRVPEDSDTYLSENYGDWKTPVSNFNILYDTPNVMLNPSLDGMVYFCLNLASVFYQADFRKQSLLAKLFADIKKNHALTD